MILLSILGGILGSALLGSNVGFADFDREVAIDGATDRVVPGRIEFSVLEPLESSVAPEMTVGLAVSSTEGTEPTCTIEQVGGDAVALSPATLNEALLDMQSRYGDYTVISTAQLAPGDYEARCDVDGEPSASSGTSFTVGRVFGMQDFSRLFGSIAGLFALWAVAALVFIIGTVLLIVGLVQRSRSKRPSQGLGPQGPGPYPNGPGSYPVGSGPGPSYQPPFPQAPYGGPQAPYGGPPGSPSPEPQRPADVPSTPPPAPPPARPEGEEGTVSGWSVPPSKR